MKILIAADLHIGANKFKTTDEKWAEPLEELVRYAIDNKVDMVAIAGDLFHHRRPTTWASEFVHRYLGLLEAFDIEVVGADGNHDDGVAADTVSATWHLNGRWASKKIVRHQENLDLNIVLMPWVTPQAYSAKSEWTLQEQLEWAQSMALAAIKEQIIPSAKNVLIGHAMVSYAGGTELAHSPNLQWAGKDVVFDYDALAKNFDAVFLGHVHDPEQLGYVGSSQPTDWGDADQVKRFVVLDTSDMSTESIPYKSALKLLDANEDTQLDAGAIHYDIARYRQDVPAGAEPSPEAVAEIRENLSKAADVVESVEINVERVVAQRVATETPLAAMVPVDAVDAYLRHTSVDPKLAKGVREKFQTVLESAK
jgi:DNA repair exonuclease SbcCD nuclease subunit